MEQVVSQLLTWGGPGLVIVVLLLVMREMYRAGRETTSQLLAEKDARIADAATVRAAMLVIQAEAHKLHAEMSRSADLLSKAIDRLADITEAQSTLAAKQAATRGREAVR